MLNELTPVLAILSRYEFPVTDTTFEVHPSGFQGDKLRSTVKVTVDLSTAEASTIDSFMEQFDQEFKPIDKRSFTGGYLYQINFKYPGTSVIVRIELAAL